MRCLACVVALFALFTPHTHAQEKPATQPAKAKFVRPGFRMVDGRYVKPQGTIALREMITLTEAGGRHRLVSRPPANVEPMLRNWRTAVVLLDDNPYAWKLSAPGRRWNDNRSEATQHLQLIAVGDDMPVDASPRLTKLTVEPERSTVQAAVLEEGVPLNVLVVFDPQFCELAVTGIGETKTLVILRAPSAREMLKLHPLETRRYLLPVMQLLTSESNPLRPAAGDVYRAFVDVPADEATVRVVRALIPDLAHADPAIRERGNRELTSLGRRGVRAAMAIDREYVPFDAADRLEAFIAANTVDSRTPQELRTNASFLADCLTDPDPAVVKAAGEAVQRSMK